MTKRYHVIGPDGATYGPAELVTLRAWAAHGRIQPTTVVREEDTGNNLFAEQVEGLFPPAGSSPAPAPGAAPAAAPAAAQQAAPQALLRVLFAPSWMALDFQVPVIVDGVPVGEGNFNQGIDVSVPLVPGRHSLELRIHLRTRQYTLDLGRPGPYLCRLSYSRLWGNFDKTVALSFEGA